MKSITNNEALLTQLSADHKLLSTNRPQFTNKSFSSALSTSLIKS